MSAAKCSARTPLGPKVMQIYCAGHTGHHNCYHISECLPCAAVLVEFRLIFVLPDILSHYANIESALPMFWDDALLYQLYFFGAL
jgi:hypothetical protein